MVFCMLVSDTRMIFKHLSDIENSLTDIREIRLIGHADIHLDTTPDTSSAPVFNTVIGQFGVGDGDECIVEGTYGRGAKTDLNHRTVDLFCFYPVPLFKDITEQDGDRTKNVGNTVFCCESHCCTRDTQTGEQGGKVHTQDPEDDNGRHNDDQAVDHFDRKVHHFIFDHNTLFDLLHFYVCNGIADPVQYNADHNNIEDTKESGEIDALGIQT